MEGSTKRLRRLLAFAAPAGALALIVAGSVAAGGNSQTVDVSSLQVAEPFQVSKRPGALSTGDVNVVVRLKGAPLAVAGLDMTPAQQRAHVQGLKADQNALLPKIEALGGQNLGRLTKALNAVIVNIDVSKTDELADLANVASVRAIGDYRLDLSDTVPHIGAAAAQAAGFDGEGVSVAVLDSGIDYTHESMGGAGTAAAYTDAYGTTTADPRNTVINDNPASTADNFPTAKVVGGFDFVGEIWPLDGPDPGTVPDPVTPDPDPIDCGDAVIPAPCAGGHGTHVADIIGGIGTSEGVGVAPGVDLYAVKVCSAVSTSCSGVALLNGMDFAMDPNGDDNISDRVDIINMSLGSSYGQKEDDLSFASTNAVKAGINVVASAGNSADRPYIVGSPSTAPEAISVAQTQVPSAKLYLIDSSVPGIPTVGGSHQPWSAPATFVNAPLVYDTTSTSTKRGCLVPLPPAGYPATNPTGNPWVGTPNAGKIVLVERGTCNVSFKVHNVAASGGVAAIIANNALQSPVDLPPDFSFGGGSMADDIPGYTITLRDSNKLKGLPETTATNANPGPSNAFGANATIDPASAVSLVFNMVASSSRGPTHSYNTIKPDIGAPGASNSAEAGTGTGNTAFGGTSGAAPMVSGSVALMLDAHPTKTPAEVKSVLMNTANTGIGINPVAAPGFGAPITRIGGGEVQVDDAINSGTAAWATGEGTGSLSFGFHTLSSNRSVTKSVTVRNYTGSSNTYAISNTFRYPSDAASGAVSLSHPSSIMVPANSSRTFIVRLSVNAANLPLWNINGGPLGGDGFLFNGLEFDGYLNLDGPGSSNDVHVAWQVLPRRSAAVTPEETNLEFDGESSDELAIENRSDVQSGNVQVFDLLGTSPQIPASALPNPGDNFAVIDLRRVGARPIDAFPPFTGADSLQFGINTFGTRAHPNYPAEFDIFIDKDQDGTDDAVIFNLENGGFAATGQNVVAAGALPAGPFSVFFFSDADLNSGNMIMTAPMSALGLTGPADSFNFDICAGDNYFTGLFTDCIEDRTYTPATPAFTTDAGQSFTVPARAETEINVSTNPAGFAASPDQTGLLFLYRLARQPRESDAITVEP